MERLKSEASRVIPPTSFVNSQHIASPGGEIQPPRSAGIRDQTRKLRLRRDAEGRSVQQDDVVLLHVGNAVLSVALAKDEAIRAKATRSARHSLTPTVEQVGPRVSRRACRRRTHRKGCRCLRVRRSESKPLPRRSGPRQARHRDNRIPARRRDGHRCRCCRVMVSFPALPSSTGSNPSPPRNRVVSAPFRTRYRRPHRHRAHRRRYRRRERRFRHFP